MYSEFACVHVRRVLYCDVETAVLDCRVLYSTGSTRVPWRVVELEHSLPTIHDG